MQNNEFKLGDVTYYFERVTTQDALKIKNSMFILARDNASPKDIEYANSINDSLCLKYLCLKDSAGMEHKAPPLATLDLIFNDNPMAIIEISKNFMEYVGAFLNALPSYQHLAR
ncbi:hypothetical protein [Campylobacter sp.]|uniref:hypothetical protein n=1 Tax=Campylobacter sp. TaxID=205 RepID=UPI0025B9076F|nr:hypothetical protein [Campylobacter sp.]